MPDRKSLIIAIDFDGTIVEHRYPDIGPPVPGAIGWINDFIAAGARVILWTMRADGQSDGNVLAQAVKFCSDYGIEFYGVNTNPTQSEWTASPKAYAHVYIDDAAYGCPLVQPINGRPYVDWDTVGPAVMKIIDGSP